MDILKQLINLPAKDLLALGVIAAVITASGNLLATLLKDLLLARSFEHWKAKRSLVSVYQRYRDPILLASIELCNRMHEIMLGTPVSFLNSEILATKPSKMMAVSAADPYFRRYKLISTIYRFCALLGWLELYRRDVTYLDSGRSKTNQRLEECIARLRSDLADGYINAAEDWQLWTDAYVFREEQRAIGEVMAATSEGVKGVLGYGAFCRALTDEGDGQQWLGVAVNFVVDLDSTVKDRNFRYVRWLMVIKHLIDLIEVLDDRRVTEKLSALRTTIEHDLQSCAIKNLQITSHRPPMLGRLMRMGRDFVS